MDAEENLTLFAKEVAKMLDMQRLYFDHKTGLSQCKKQEAHVRKMCKGILNPGLFKDPDPPEGGE